MCWALLGADGDLAEDHLADRVVHGGGEARDVCGVLLWTEVHEAVHAGEEELGPAGPADPDDLLDPRHPHAGERWRRHGPGSRIRTSPRMCSRPSPLQRV